MPAKRISLSLLAIAMVSLVVSASSFALFSAQSGNANNTFTTGTVTLGTPMVTLVDVHNIAPGDSGVQNYAIQYTGSLDAWLGISTATTGDLMTCDGGKFNIALQDAGGVAYSANAPDQVVGPNPVSTGFVLNLNVNWALDLSAGNDCQAKSAQLSLMVKAVQSRHNTNGTNDGPISWN